MPKNITILYVEDEPGIRDSLSGVLDYFCDELIVANDGVDGLRCYKEHLPDIVVSDIKMPNMNGIEMVRAIKQINPRQHIIYTTAHSESAYFLDAIDMQVDGYILKPVNLDKLEDKIESIKDIIFTKENLKNTQIIIDEIAKLQDNLLVVLDKNLKIIYCNNQFLNFFAIKDIEEFENKFASLNDIFIKDDEFCHAETLDKWMKLVSTQSDENGLVSIYDENKSASNIFVTSIKTIEKTNHTIITLIEITNLATQKQELKNKAYSDELTKIYNRAYFNQELEKEISKFKRTLIPFTIIMFDIDHFKEFNDNYGHIVGDDILIELTNKIYHKTRVSDTFARWGGEEFVIILPATDLQNGLIAAENLRISVKNNLFKNDLKLTCSFGVTQVNNDDCEKSIMKRVDEALYLAKNGGRDIVKGI
jgi:diguanylate cyclase (GGDEF)-like protein